MDKPLKNSKTKTVDSLQERLTSYAYDLQYAALPPEVVHTAKVCTIDTLGAVIAGFFGEPCRIARSLAAQMPNPTGATVIGTQMKTTPDMAAFVNALTGHYAEIADSYHWPGSSNGHPSSTLTPILAAAEFAQSSGRDFITSIVLGYELFLRVSDAFCIEGFDSANFTCLATAAGAGKLLGLTPEQLSHCLSMAVVPNNILKQGIKAASFGNAGRGGVFAAMLAKSGMEGPHMPFEGKAGWCEHVARKHFSLDTLGGSNTPFKILNTNFKTRPANGSSVICILAAEKVAPLKNIKDVKQVIVEAYKAAKKSGGTGEHRWNPKTRESADDSIPYVVAATLMDGTVTRRSYNDAHLRNPELRALMKKVEVVENAEYTNAFDRLPVEHHVRVTVVNQSGERFVGKTGGGNDDFATPKSDAQIEAKFRELTEEVLGAKQVKTILDRLWHLEDLTNVAEIPSLFVLD